MIANWYHSRQLRLRDTHSFSQGDNLVFIHPYIVTYYVNTLQYGCNTFDISIIIVSVKGESANGYVQNTSG
jgi:hypothetical protein